MVGVTDAPVDIRVVYGAAEGGIAGGGPVHPELPVAEQQVGADDHAVPVVLEGLCRVDATDLPDTAGICRPQVRLRRVRHAVLGLHIPRLVPVPDPYVVHEPFAVRVAPRPAEPCGDACRGPLDTTLPDELLHLLGRVGDRERHPPVRSPGHRIGGVQSQQPLDPSLVPLAATRPERSLQIGHLDHTADLLGELLEIAGRTHLVRADRLVVVEQEDRNAGGPDQLGRLRPVVVAKFLRCPPVCRAAPQAVRLVADEDLDAVLRSLGEAVEVLVQPEGRTALVRHLPAAGRTDHDLTQGLRVRMGSAGQHRLSALEPERTLQLQGDGALPAARSASKDVDPFAVGIAGGIVGGVCVMKEADVEVAGRRSPLQVPNDPVHRNVLLVEEGETATGDGPLPRDISHLEQGLAAGLLQ